MDRAIYHLEHEGEKIALCCFAVIGNSECEKRVSLYSGVSHDPPPPDCVGKEWLVSGPEGSFTAGITETIQLGDIWKVLLRQTGDLMGHEDGPSHEAREQS